MERSPGNAAWLGQGWAFPPEFHPSRGVKLVSAEQDIAQSLEILLSTSPGERVMNPSFGCGLRSLVFSSISETTTTRIRDAVERAVLFFEPRIELENVVVDVADVYQGLMMIQLNYRVKSTNSRSNIVYPFYISEGTAVPSELE